MAYDYFVSKISNIGKNGLDRIGMPRWVDHLQGEFKKVVFAGDLDFYGLFTKDELIKSAERYAEIFTHPRDPDSDHHKALEYIQNSDDAVFLVSVIWWESGSF